MTLVTWQHAACWLASRLDPRLEGTRDVRYRYAQLGACAHHLTAACCQGLIVASFCRVESLYSAIARKVLLLGRTGRLQLPDETLPGVQPRHSIS